MTGEGKEFVSEWGSIVMKEQLFWRISFIQVNGSWL